MDLFDLVDEPTIINGSLFLYGYKNIILEAETIARVVLIHYLRCWFTHGVDSFYAVINLLINVISNEEVGNKLDDSGRDFIAELTEMHNNVSETDGKNYRIDEDGHLLATNTRRRNKRICTCCLYFLNKITPSAPECKYKGLCAGVRK